MTNKRYTAADVAATQFYQLPKWLFDRPEYKTLSSDAKVLYALLQDRHKLSIANSWANDKGEVYLVFTRDNMGDMLGVSAPTVRKAIAELNAAGLLEEERQGLNKPNRIFLCKPRQTALNRGVKDSFGQERKILSPNKTDINNIISKQDNKAKTPNGDLGDHIPEKNSRELTSADAETFIPMPVFPTIEDNGNIFARTTTTHGPEDVKWGIDITDLYIDELYPQSTGRLHPTLNRPQRMAFVGKLLDFVNCFGLSGHEPQDVLRSILSDSNIPDPTVLIATSPKVLGNHALKAGYVMFDDLAMTQYCPTDDYY